MLPVQDLVARASDLARNPEADGGLTALRREPRSQLQAAFAYAKRRSQDPAMADAADMLELALVIGARKTFEGARWWHRGEVLVGGMAMVNGLHLATLLWRSAQLGWVAPVAIVAFVAASIVAVVAWRRKVLTVGVPVSVQAGLPASAGRIPEIAERVVRTAHDALADGTDERRELADLLRRTAPPGDSAPARLLGAAGLAYAERLVALGFEPKRGVLLAAAGTAREELLDELPDGWRP